MYVRAKAKAWVVSLGSDTTSPHDEVVRQRLGSPGIGAVACFYNQNMGAFNRQVQDAFDVLKVPLQLGWPCSYFCAALSWRLEAEGSTSKQTSQPASQPQ